MNTRPQHWLRKVMAEHSPALAIAEKIEDADERVANLKLQIIAVQESRKKLELSARELAGENVSEEQLTEAVTTTERDCIVACQLTATILQAETQRLFVIANPFLNELVAPELDKINTTSESLSRWKSFSER